MSRLKPPMRPDILTLATTTSLALASLGLGAGIAGANPSNWNLLEAISFSEVEKNGEWQVVKEFPTALQEMTGEFTITGYYVPIEAQAYVTQFLLVPDPEDCPFCGSSGYGISLEVRAASPIPDVEEATKVTVRGTLELIDDPYTYQFARLHDAELIDSGI